MSGLGEALMPFVGILPASSRLTHFVRLTAGQNIIGKTVGYC